MTTIPLSALTATWNAAGTTFTGIGLNVTDTASAAGSLLMDLQVGGTSRFRVRKDGETSGPSSGNIGIAGFASYLTTAQSDAGFYAPSVSGGLFLGSGYDAVLRRDAADTLAQRRGTNAQAFRLYNTFTDASNYERADIAFLSNVFRIGTFAAGTGTARHMDFLTGGVERWRINTSGHFLASADNTYDIGASGANRPRSIYVATRTFSPDFYADAAGIFGINNRLQLASSADGIARFTNWAGSDFFRLQFGGTTASFPALKRSTTSLQARLADDTGFTNIQGKLTTETAYTAGAPTPTGYLVLYDSNGTAYKVPAEAV